MWILLNNKPFNIWSVKEISEAKPLTNYDLITSQAESQGYYAQLKYKFNDVYKAFQEDKKSIIAQHIKEPAEQRIQAVERYAYNSNKIWGWYFVVETTDREYIISSLFPTEDRATQVRNELLIHINKAEASLPIITI